MLILGRTVHMAVPKITQTKILVYFAKIAEIKDETQVIAHNKLNGLASVLALILALKLTVRSDHGLIKCKTNPCRKSMQLVHQASERQKQHIVL